MPYIELSQRTKLSTNSKHKILPIKTRFNSLYIWSNPYKIINRSGVYYDCKCECGEIISVRGSALLAGTNPTDTHAIRSCGCKRNETISNKIKPHHCTSCGETNPKKFGKLNKSKCSRCYGRIAYHNDSKPAYFRRLISGIRSRAHRKNKKRIACTINASYLINLWDKQNGRCAISGLKMILEKRSLFSASADRKESKLDYTDDNVQLVCVAINLAKQSHTDSQIRQFLDSYVTQCLSEQLG